ncbi:MAG: hypothetical protein Q4C58_11405 [Eubacteriales bacterium]|nr:hypothetical protein [Eubacteriales bacterium]
MLNWENIIALRMQRQCLKHHADQTEYEQLYRDLSPGLNVHWHGFGQPPCLVYRTDFDDVALNGKRQLKRELVKGRFQNGNIGFVEARMMELFACLYQKPYRPAPYSDLLLHLIEREGPMNIEVMKEMTGLLVKQITPALHRLQESFLVFEDQNDGEWDRGWYLFEEMFPEADLNRYTRQQALECVLPRLFYRFVYLNTENARHFLGLPKKDVKAALEKLAQEEKLVSWQNGWLLPEDKEILQGADFEPMKGILALHRNDPLVRIDEWHLKEEYKGKEKGSEVMQYLLIDGQIRGAVMGHFRYGPYDLHEIRVDLPEAQMQLRREEIWEAVREVNGKRENEGEIPFAHCAENKEKLP